MKISSKTLFTYLAAAILLVNQVLAGTFSDGEHTDRVIPANLIVHEWVSDAHHTDLRQDASNEYCDVHCHVYCHAQLLVQVPSLVVFHAIVSQQSTPSFSLEHYRLSRIAPPVPPPIG